MGARRNRSKAKKVRKNNAIMAQQHLSNVVNSVSSPLIVRKNAVKHLVRTSSRNRLRLPKNTSLRICKKCKNLLLIDGASRVRIRDGQRIITCLNCNAIRRYGGGPKYNGGVLNDKNPR